MANEEKKKDGVFLNRVHEKMIRQTSGKNGDFYNVSISCPVELSDSGFASFSVNEGQIFQSTRKVSKDSDERVDVPNYKNILLGDADRSRKLNVKKGDKFEQIDKTNTEIMQMFEEEKKKYNEAKKETEKGSREVPDVEVEAAQAGMEAGV